MGIDQQVLCASSNSGNWLHGWRALKQNSRIGPRPIMEFFSQQTWSIINPSAHSYQGCVTRERTTQVPHLASLICSLVDLQVQKCQINVEQLSFIYYSVNTVIIKTLASILARYIAFSTDLGTTNVVKQKEQQRYQRCHKSRSWHEDGRARKISSSHKQPKSFSNAAALWLLLRLSQQRLSQF